MWLQTWEDPGSAFWLLALATAMIAPALGYAGQDDVGELAKEAPEPRSLAHQRPLQNNFEWGGGHDSDGFKQPHRGTFCRPCVANIRVTKVRRSIQVWNDIRPERCGMSSSPFRLDLRAARLMRGDQAISLRPKTWAVLAVPGRTAGDAGDEGRAVERALAGRDRRRGHAEQIDR